MCDAVMIHPYCMTEPAGILVEKEKFLDDV